MKDNEILLNQLIEFITNKYGDIKDINEDTRIEEDLRIIADEACDFLIDYGKQFNVYLGNFMAADYFEAEGCDFITPILELFKLKKKSEFVKKELTIGDLIKGIKAGKLDEEVINKQLPTSPIHPKEVIYEDFYDYEWHDAVIKNITIDRNDPGIKDIISFEIKSVDGGIDMLLFEDVYWANFNLNFGLIVKETILNVDQKDVNYEEHPSILKKIGKGKKIKMKVYTINLNSTGGTIKVVAKKFTIIRIKDK